jgi:hypothetical protein
MYVLHMIHFSSYCIVAIEEASIKLSLSKWYMLLSFAYVCTYVLVLFVHFPAIVLTFAFGLLSC